MIDDFYGYDDPTWMLNRRLEREQEIEPRGHWRRRYRVPISVALGNKTPAMNVATPREIVGNRGS